MRRDQVSFERGHTFPLLNHHHDIQTRIGLRREARFEVGCGKIFNTASFGANIGDDLFELGEKKIAFTFVKLNRCEHYNHGKIFQGVGEPTADVSGGECFTSSKFTKSLCLLLLVAMEWLAYSEESSSGVAG